MKFLVDAQLPRRLAHYLRSEGFDAVHTLDLADQNRTFDVQINSISLTEKRVVISKDSDFYNSFFSRKEPFKLLFLTVGNCSNAQLLDLFAANLELITSLLKENDVIQLSRSRLIVIC
jgi:predicted nuclease of predicted toxin-antitoxin system